MYHDYLAFFLSNTREKIVTIEHNIWNFKALKTPLQLLK